jgi:hypothetical protein
MGPTSGNISGGNLVDEAVLLGLVLLLLPPGCHCSMDAGTKTVPGEDTKNFLKQADPPSVLRCLFNASNRLNDRLHTGQIYGLSPVCNF